MKRGSRDVKVGFIGLGSMGNPMASNVLAAGYDMTVYDVVREKGENLEAGGATWGSNPREVAGRSDVVFTSLPGPAEVEAVVLGDDGVFAGLNKGGAYVDTTTNAPATMRNIAKIGASRGLEVLDAPISGGIFGARDGSLTVFVGGEKAIFDHFQPVMQSFGKNVVHMGPAGAGNVTKLVNNLMMFINFVGACEGLAMGAKSGIDPRVLIEVITPSMGDSRVLRHTVRRALRGEEIASAMDLAVKDMQAGRRARKGSRGATGSRTAGKRHDHAVSR